LAIDRILSEKDLQFFDQNGYIVVKNLIPGEMCDEVVKSMWKFLGMTPNKPNDWYRPPATPFGMIELYHDQAMWNTRQHPKVYKTFTELWNTGKLWVSVDRLCFKTPRNSNYKNYDHRGFVHWDLDPWEEELPFGLQGVLVLEDTEEDQGGFHCVPGMHKYLKEWIKNVPVPPQRERFHTAGYPINVPKYPLQKLKVKKIAAKKGDFIIWRRELAHGNGHNVSKLPRLAQYINMFPERNYSERRTTTQECLHPETRYERIHMWENNGSPFHKPGDVRRFEETHDKAQLTDLGKKILGLELWEDQK